MALDRAKANQLCQHLRSVHGKLFDELSKEAERLANYLKTKNFNIIAADESHKHVGAIIVDFVLQVGKNWRRQVRPAVERIKHFSEASRMSGFQNLLSNKGLKVLIGWEGVKTENDLFRVASFFTDRGIDNFDQLYDWLEPEAHRDELMKMKRLADGGVFGVSDKTADYLRKLVRHWDAVAVDTHMKQLLREAGITSRYSYKEKRAIVQLAAILYLNCRPVDLDHSIYHNHKEY